MSPSAWEIDLGRSVVGFAVRHLVVARVRGRFRSWSATLHFDEADLARSQVEVDIGVASVETGVADRDAHLRSAEFFDAARFPSIHFVSQAVTPVGPDRFRLVGALTMHGVTREVALEVARKRRARGAERIAFSARGQLSRSDFGLTWNRAIEAGGVLVSERVEVEIEVEAGTARADRPAKEGGAGATSSSSGTRA